MSKLSTKRKITVDLNVKSLTDQPKSRPSVFERLGTKASTQLENFCRHWAQNGTCPYNKTCKYANTHQLISPSKQRLIKKDGKEDPNKRLHSTIVKAGRNSELEFENWDQTALEYADADALEKRRQELQRELELQLKMESKQVHKKDKKPKKRESSTSSTGSSSSTTDSSSSSDDTTTVSSSTSKESHRRKLKKPKGKHSSSSSDDIALKKKMNAKNAAAKRAVAHSKLQVAVRHTVPAKKISSPAKKVPKTPPSKLSRSPTRPLSSTPPLKIKSSTPLKIAKKVIRKSRSVDRKRGTPSPRPRDRDDKYKKEREREKEREKLKERHERTLTPKKDNRLKETRKRESPVRTHVRRRDDRSIDKRDDRRNKDRSLERPRKDGRHDDRERDPKRMTREEREAAREKEREEALARCQERQRERERLKKMAEKERELQLRNRERERGIDKGSDRLLPLRLSELDRGSSKTSRDKSLDRGSDRSYNRIDRREPRDRRSDRYDHIDRPYRERGFERDPDRSERDYPDRRLHPEDKTYSSPYDNRRVREDRHYVDPETDRYEDHRDYPERRETWDDREPGRYVRDSARPIHKNREDYNRHDWAERPDWEREEWEQANRTEEEWRGYERPAEWQGEDRRRNWQGSDWADRSLKRPPFTARPTKPSPLVREEKVTTPKEDGRSSVASPSVKVEVKSEVEPEVKPDPVDSPAKKPLEVKVETGVSVKRSAESPVEGVPEPKKACTPAPAEPIAPLEPDDLSEISDDADEILNREDDLQEPATVPSMDQDAVADPTTLDTVGGTDKLDAEIPSLTTEVSDTKPLSPKPTVNGAPSTSMGESPKPTTESGIDQSAADDETLDQLGFEEISDEELEEETKAKGLGDALGVDWASLVAESRPRIKTSAVGSAKKRWEPHRVLARIGVSIEMAGAKIVNEIFDKVKQDEIEEGKLKLEEIKSEIKEEGEKKKSTIHPIAGMQVSLRDWKTKRRTLFANAGPQKRALCARRDLEIRRYLCKLPTKDTIGLGDAQHPHDPEIFRMALKLYERTL